ncbi:MAG: NAD(P)H-binding protein [Halioglobus sp.]
MKSSSVLIVGCGDLGNRTAGALLEKNWQVTGVRRTLDRLAKGVEGIQADYTEQGSLDFSQNLEPDFVLAIFNPFDRSEAGYIKGFKVAMENLLSGLGEHKPRHIVMSSSTRVFAECEGGYVDEDSALSTDDPWAQAIIAAERLLLGSGHNASIVRFAGIYGIPGGRLLSRIRRGELCPSEPLRYTNRIHREDCGGFLSHLLFSSAANAELAPIYIGVDDCPAPRFEVESWIANKMGMEVRDSLDTETSPQPTRHNSAGHRRCKNVALTRSGYRLRYPSYKEGYGALLEDH